MVGVKKRRVMTAFTRQRAAPALFGTRFVGARRVHSGPRFVLYEATDETNGRRVSVKAPTDRDADWTAAALLREAGILGRLGGHPHVITLFERFTLSDGQPALVLERCSGSLGDLTGTYRPSVRNVSAMGIKLCGALETAHHADVLHTGVCPANVWVTEWGEPVLANFEESAPVAGGAPQHALHATSPHTAPELLEGGAPTEATDVYGLAVTLYELLAGHPAFPAHRDERQSETSLRILRGVYAPLPSAVPIELADLICWAMAVDPAQRPPTPAWLAEGLLRFEQRQGWTRTVKVAVR
jgi:serine/threonine protein kinase